MAKTKVIKDNSERWLLTYADLMNLLLILFIILYTMSKTDSARYQAVANSLRSALGESAANTIVIGGGSNNSLISLDSSAPSSVIPSKIEDAAMQEVKDEVDKLIKAGNLEGKVEVKLEERGAVISITDQVLFKSGSADIEPQSMSVIDTIGKSILLAMPDNHIRIEGHTDTDPMNSARFPDNQELSTARANNVYRYLIKNVGLNPKIMSTVGYGENVPKVNNDTPANKAINRRVDVVILKSIYNKSEAGMSTTEGTGETTPSGEANQHPEEGGNVSPPAEGEGNSNH